MYSVRSANGNLIYKRTIIHFNVCVGGGEGQIKYTHLYFGLRLKFAEPIIFLYPQFLRAYLWCYKYSLSSEMNCYNMILYSSVYSNSLNKDILRIPIYTPLHSS